ncbi:MAG TPA: hypothetical protein VH109_01170 [Steroidobacteraceae bacterium]|jgi:hypothetical protein|nr:hypothetical protein [Steroidobacteraceae bacterium]
MKSYKLALALLVSACAAGCAHPMNIKPDVQGLEPASGRIQKNVGLYISPAERALEVTTAGGGGDKVKYHPYADMETGLYKALGNVFTSVTLVSTPDDASAIAKHSLNYIVEPTITTTSSSSGIFTWMATDFTVQVTCKVDDARGKQVATVSSTGTGKADSAEVRSDFSIAGERASKDALQKLETAFLQAPELKE